MNTKRNPQNVSNSYNGGNSDTIGRDSPSALLEVLAEVASQTLHSEKKHINSMLTLQFKPKTTNMKRNMKETCFTVSQLASMPVSHLVKQFAVFTSDELKRQYSYACALMPDCHQKYTSFASEEKARAYIKSHLEEHLEQLKANKETYDTFTAISVNHKNFKTNLQNKRSRMQQIKKPQETLNKENKDVILEKSTNYLRKILLNDISVKENEKQKCSQKSENKETYDSVLKKSEEINTKVLGDHSYSERLDDKIPNRRETSLNNVPDDTTGEENIVLMVVGTDSVHMKEYSHQKLTENCLDSNIVYSPDKTQISTESNSEMSATKPKGKAKFIGTSKEEREMALAYIERIKKKGNPSGNNLQCRICDPPRSFTAPTTLVSHYRSHAGIKPYECRICKAVFTRRHSLKYHMLIHQNQTRFTCTDCGKKFRHPSHFREHQRRHTGEAPFGCDDCGQRFKTRNTYKRHLKTRHNKILTTFGEVLHPPEEENQKIRNSRKKKDCAPEDIMNVINNTDAIVNFENHDETQVITSTIEEYVLKEDIPSDRNWETNDIIHIDKFEICSESDLNKTDGIETEIAIECNYPDRENSNVNVEYINGTEGGLLQLKNSFYDNLRVTNNEDHIIYQHDIDDNIYECSNEVNCEIDIKDETLTEEQEVENTMRQANTDFSEEQDGNNLQLLQESTHDYHKKICDSDTQEGNKHLKTKATNPNENDQKHDEKYDIDVTTEVQNDVTSETSINCADNFDIGNKEHLRNIFCAQVLYTNIDVSQTCFEVSEGITPKRQNNILEECECISQSVATDVVEILNISSKDFVEVDPKADQRQSQYLYVRSEQLSKLIAQNKYVTIPVHQIKECRDHGLQAKVDNHRSIYIINEDIRTIIKPISEKQSTILVLSSNSCKNSIFQIEKNSIIVKALKR
ncbi:uncharacterized protein LOC105840733 [Monomorium pharaonis]|uniref:uncharacterized protein LOC105840733 n=1 Tax=Monomorium pharaonis TaxID=307658 RepID=UPI00063FB060|nr:uncharacterized protein LOC105840733 [Monomorium pharaonis]